MRKLALVTAMAILAIAAIQVWPKPPWSRRGR